MSDAHWSTYDLEWIRRVCPELDNTPVYLLSESELPEDCRSPDSIAYTGKVLDLLAKPSLSDQGRWCGRGPIIVVRPPWFKLEWCNKAGVLLHELSHIFERFGSWNNGLSLIDEVCSIPGGEDFVVQAFRHQIDPGSYETLTHGMQFIRASIHLSQRSGMAIENMFLTSPEYKQPALSDCVNTLRVEVDAGGHLGDIMAGDPPHEFTALFEQNDAENAGVSAEKHQF